MADSSAMYAFGGGGGGSVYARAGRTHDGVIDERTLAARRRLDEACDELLGVGSQPDLFRVCMSILERCNKRVHRACQIRTTRPQQNTRRHCPHRRHLRRARTPSAKTSTRTQEAIN
jgi:hypothetical protein